MPPLQLQTTPQEDLSVVLGRFHDWDALQKGVPPPASMHSANGVREVSYEEALAARRPGRALRQPTPAPVSAGEPALPVAAFALLAPNPVDIQINAPSPALLDTEVQATQRTAVKVARRNKTTSTIATNRGIHTGTDLKRGTSPVAKSASQVIAGATQTAPSGIARKKKEVTFRGALVECVKAAPAKPGKRAGGAALPGASRSGNVETAVARSHKRLPMHVRAAELQAAEPPRETTSASRTARVNVSLTPGEYARLRNAAAATGMKLPAYLRESVLQMQMSRERGRVSLQDQKAARSPQKAPEAQTVEFIPYNRPGVEDEKPRFLSRMKDLWFGRRLTVTA